MKNKEKSASGQLCHNFRISGLLFFILVFLSSALIIWLAKFSQSLNEIKNTLEQIHIPLSENATIDQAAEKLDDFYLDIRVLNKNLEPYYLQLISEALYDFGIPNAIWNDENGQKLITAYSMGYNLPAYFYQKESNGNNLEQYLQDILAAYGFAMEAIQITHGRISERTDLYYMIYDAPFKELSSSGDWILAVWDVLEGKYSLPGGHVTLFESTKVFNLPFPPWLEAEKICDLIAQEGLPRPSHYDIYRQSYATDLDPYNDILFGFELSEDRTSLILDAFHKFTGFTSMSGEDEMKIRIIARAPSKKMYQCTFKVSEGEIRFSKIYPLDFHPDPDPVTPGTYYFTYVFDNQRMCNFECIISSTNSLSCDVTKEFPVYSCNGTQNQHLQNPLDIILRYEHNLYHPKL